MTRERALKVLEMFLDKQCSIERTLNHMDTTDVEIWDAVYTATKALSVEPCEDAISFPKGTLKKRGKGYVVYNPEWLKENWRTELKVMGIECEDAISRAAAIKAMDDLEQEDIELYGCSIPEGFDGKRAIEALQSLTSVAELEHAISKADAMRLVSQADLKGLLSQDDACLVSVASVKRALEQEPSKITSEDVKGYCKPRCLTIITNELLYELTHPKIKTLEQEPCEDAISRQAVMDAIEELKKIHFDRVVVLNKVCERVLELPPVTPKQKMGRWIESNDIKFYKCSECGCYWERCMVENCNMDFCPNCGCQMKGEGE